MTADTALAVLVAAALKATVILAPALVFATLARRASAAARHFLCFLAVAAALVLPALEIGAAGTGVGLLPPDPVAEAVTVPLAPGVPPPAPAETGATELALALWLAGCGLLLTRQALAAQAVYALRRAAHPLRDRRVARAFASVRNDLGLERRVGILVHPGLSVPATCGILRPVVLLPEVALRWGPSRLRAVLLHELAHVRRRDTLTQMIAELCCAVYWFHPLAWFAAGRMRDEREAACDDPVLTRGARPSGYAELLLNLLAGLRGGVAVPGPALSLGGGKRFERRLRSLLFAPRSRGPLPRVPAVAFVLGILTAGIALAALRPGSARDATPPADPVPVETVLAPAPSTPTTPDRPAMDRERAEALAFAVLESMGRQKGDGSASDWLRDETLLKKLLGAMADTLEARAGGKTGGDRPALPLELVRAMSRGDWRFDGNGRTVLDLKDPALLERLRKSGGFCFEASAGFSDDSAGEEEFLERFGRSITLGGSLGFEVEGLGR